MSKYPQPTTNMTFQKPAIGDPKLSFLKLAVFLAIGAFIIIALDLMDGTPLMADIDDNVRRIQINDLLSDGEWYDRRLPGVIDYTSHWSRIVDAPYYLLTKGLSLFMPNDEAALWAERLVPLGLLIVFICAFTAIIRRMASLANPSDPTILTLILTPILALAAVLEFVPGRIDHHNFQILCVMFMAWGLLPKYDDQRRDLRAITIGLAIIISLSIGLETLPIILALLSVLVINAALGKSRPQYLCRHIGLTLFLVTVPFSLITLGLKDSTEAHCDAISAPWIIALSLGGFWLWLGTRNWSLKGDQGGSRIACVTKRLFIFGVGSVIVLAITLWLFPKCLGGPFEMASPLARKLWLDGFGQEKSIFAVFSLSRYETYVKLVFFYLILSAILAFVLAPHYKHWPNALKIFAIITIISVVFVIIQIRHIRLTAVLISLFVPMAVTQYRFSKPEILARIMRLSTALYLMPLGVMIFAYLLIPKSDDPMTAHSILRWDTCNDGDFSVLEKLPHGSIITPIGLSQFLFEQGRPHDLAAIQYQRSAKGIHDILTVFFTDDTEAINAALAKYDYLAICRTRTSLPLLDSPIYASLNSGDDWKGLQAIENPTGSRFQVYKILKTAETE